MIFNIAQKTICDISVIAYRSKPTFTIFEDFAIKANRVFRSLSVTTETTLDDILTKNRKDLAKDDLKEVALYKRDKVK